MKERKKLMNKAFFDMIYLINCSLNEVIPDSDRVAQMDTNALVNLSKTHSLTFPRSIILPQLSDIR